MAILMKLWRPTGINELRLIYESGMRSFPARLIDQPIFYPVTNLEYACQIAKDWNNKQTGCGYVLSFEVESTYANKFERKIVGAAQHEELWVPAELLADFNSKISGNINLECAFFNGDFNGFKTPMPSFGGLHDAFHTGSAMEQLTALCSTELSQRLTDVVQSYNTCIYLTYPYWKAIAREYSQTSVLTNIRSAWTMKFAFELCENGTYFS
jgi:hypothetical protein